MGSKIGPKNKILLPLLLFDQLFLKLNGKFSAIRNSLINQNNHAKMQSAQRPQKS